jgi:hypothetical protein
MEACLGFDLTKVLIHLAVVPSVAHSVQVGGRILASEVEQHHTSEGVPSRWITCTCRPGAEVVSAELRRVEVEHIASMLGYVAPEFAVLGRAFRCHLVL